MKRVLVSPLLAFLSGVTVIAWGEVRDDVPIESIYNQGVSLYRDGSFAEAAEHFQQAAAAQNRTVASKSRFNLGNTHYARALASLQAKPQPDSAAAIMHLENAIQNYRSALRLEPSDVDARANIELASRLIQQLKDQQQQDQQKDEQQQDQQKDEQQQDEQQQDQQQQDQQQQDQQQQDQQKDEQQQDQQQDQQKDKQQQDQQQDQQKDQQQQDQQQQDQQQPGDQQQDQQEQDQQQPNNKDESKPTESLDQQEQNQDEKQEEPPKGELSAADPSQETPDESLEQSMIPEEAMEMTEEEARKMLQAIRDRDMLRRLRRQAAQRSQRIPVERDW